MVMLGVEGPGEGQGVKCNSFGAHPWLCLGEPGDKLSTFLRQKEINIDSSKNMTEWSVFYCHGLDLVL
jgi:hypothetical protein